MNELPLKGVVKKVEKELEHVTIDHEAVPGFMGAMKMRFSYKDRARWNVYSPATRWRRRCESRPKTMS